MTINKLVFDLDSFNLIEKNITQPLVVGQHDFYKFEFEFRQNNEVINNPLWAVRVLFERPDGEGSNELSVLLNNGKYEKKLSSWVSDIAGDLKISVLVNNMAFTQVLLPVRAGLTPSGDTITNMQYQALLNNINVVNNALEEHKLDTDNPHDINNKIADYTYDRETIDDKDTQVLSEAKAYADNIQLEADLSNFYNKPEIDEKLEKLEVNGGYL
jgi:hypothetical protein